MWLRGVSTLEDRTLCYAYNDHDRKTLKERENRGCEADLDLRSLQPEIPVRSCLVLSSDSSFEVDRGLTSKRWNRPWPLPRFILTCMSDNEELRRKVETAQQGIEESWNQVSNWKGLSIHLSDEGTDSCPRNRTDSSVLIRFSPAINPLSNQPLVAGLTSSAPLVAVDQLTCSRQK
jgi:hypothetical protein